MKMRIVAIGRIRSGPEREMLDDYAQRTQAVGRPIGLGPLDETEIDNRNLHGKTAESEAIVAAAATADRVVLLDERGKTLNSRQFATQLEAWRDEGVRETAFCIGGADGHDRTAFKNIHLSLAFGPAVWPHKLVRIMLAEQIYRAGSILAGTPYHRD